MLRLVAYTPGKVLRFPVHRSELVIVSVEECDICLPFTGETQHHAHQQNDNTELRIEDLGTR